MRDMRGHWQPPTVLDHVGLACMRLVVDLSLWWWMEKQYPCWVYTGFLCHSFAVAYVCSDRCIVNRFTVSMADQSQSTSSDTTEQRHHWLKNSVWRRFVNWIIYGGQTSERVYIHSARFLVIVGLSSAWPIRIILSNGIIQIATISHRIYRHSYLAWWRHVASDPLLGPILIWWQLDS